MKKRRAWMLVGVVTAFGLVFGGLQITRSRIFVVAHFWAPKADLTDAVLRGASLAGANLQGARLVTADLRGADLRGANLRHALLIGTDLRGANLAGADLRDAELMSNVFVQKRGAKLYTMVTECTNLQGADLRGADLRGASLQEFLDGARKIPAGRWARGEPNFAGARYDARTRWPDGYRYGAVLVK